MKTPLVIAALVLASCTPAGGPHINPFWSPERQACVRDGGHWGKGGLLQLEMCFPHYADAGKACTASTQCQGMCDAQTRQCTETFRFGCQSYLNDVGETAAICVD